MPLDMATLVSPSHTAVLTMEMQRGVIGDLAAVPTLAEEVAAQGTIGRTSRLVVAARQAGVRVVHCTAEFRPDGAGSAGNCPVLAAARREPDRLIIGTPTVDVVPELGPEPADIISSRVHGMTPFTGTSLDVMLRNLGITTVIATGVSVNIGIVGLVIEAVDLGYQVVLPTDCVAGVPEEYAQAVIKNTLSLLTTRTTADKLIAIWSA
ncbi:MAG TPA: cysteine hydrolase [Acidimicrobiales bacterium]|jgi:nicotinamidase-related amidase